ncbi:MAG: hypothetical protein GY787_21485, partial [Alteromonadales bacterium]|nr:hypothetical protein [Alteromonadales bacterium]
MNYEIKTNSLAKQLMLSVFFWYMLIAIILTTTHLVIEYAESKAKVEANIQIIAKTFSPSLAQSLWDVNFEQTNSAFLGMVEVRQVTGLKLASDTGELIASSGVTSVTEGFEQMSGIISYDFDISFQHKNKLIKVGQGTIYSNNQVVIEQLQEHLQYLIISALLKSLALWFLFLFMAKRQLHTPLTQLIKQIDFDKKNPYKTHPINLQLKRSNELTILENSFNDWQQTRTHYQEEISQHAKNLEITVQERTQQLEIAKQEAESSKNRADTANQYKTEFLAKTSHELRTPLNAIINLSHNLDSAQLQPPYSQQLNLIQRASDNLLVIINDILDISKIEAGNLSLQPSTLDLNKLIKNTIKTLEILADKKGLILNYTMPNNEPHFVYTDRSRLQQILVNLINNAIKFTQQGSVQLTVTIVATQEDSSLYQFDIIDTGVGIDKQYQGTIFDKFTRVHNSKTNNTEGSGLGLTICQQLTKLMGGKLYFKSEVDIGTTFTLQLP